MTKREFLQSSLAAAAVSTLNLNVPMAGADEPRTNWAGNYTFHAKQVLHPTSVAEVQDAVRSATSLRALGSRHSFNGIADSPETQLSTLGLGGISVDKAARTVTVGAGVKYGDLALALDREGFALHNMASLPHITVGGSIATATHGSGVRNGNLSSSVTAIRFVAADGTLHTLSRPQDGDRFAGAVVGLGALGIVTEVTLQVQPSYQMSQVVYRNLSFDQLQHNFAAIMGTGYSLSLFTNWQNHRAWEVWIKRREDEGASHPPPPEFYGATLATEKLHPVLGQNPEKTTEQGKVEPWYAILPHFKMEFTPSTGREIQTEFFVPFEHAYEAVEAVEQLRDRISPHLYVTEVRAIAADDLWMSMAYHQRSLSIHFTWKPEPEAVLAVLPQIEAALAPFNPRPHWGKVFTLKAPQIVRQYPRFQDFRALVASYDPKGKFRNAFMDQDVWGA